MKNKQQTKVLLVSPFATKSVGGIGTWTKSVLDYFDYSEEVSIFFQNTANVIKGNAKGGNLRRYILGSLDAISILIQLFFNILIKRPDVVHYTSSASLALMKDSIAVFITKKLFHKRFVIHWHFGRIPNICISRDQEYSRLIKIIRRADENIVLDKKSLDALYKEGCNNVCCIPNPVTSAIFDATKNIKIDQANLMRNEGEVLFVGHIIESKGVIELVNSCAECQMVKKLVFVGLAQPSVKEKILALSKKRLEQQWVEFAGEKKREEVYAYYKKCSVFCLPSYTEGFPYVILEAMAFGCPIIATDVGAISEMLKDDAGYVVSPRNKEDLTVALNLVLSDKLVRENMSNNAYNRVMSEYSRDAICMQLYRVWANK